MGEAGDHDVGEHLDVVGRVLQALNQLRDKRRHIDLQPSNKYICTYEYEQISSDYVWYVVISK